jgi:hypothetical protein
MAEHVSRRVAVDRLGDSLPQPTLPTAANPGFEAGRLCGESKLQMFSQLSAEGLKWVAPFTSIRRSANPDTPATDLAAALQAFTAAGLDFPVVAKPHVVLFCSSSRDARAHPPCCYPLNSCKPVSRRFPPAIFLVLAWSGSSIGGWARTGH